MTILIDGRPLVAPSAGIANFMEGSLTAWAKACPGDIFYVALPRPLHKTINTSTYPSNILLVEHSNRLSRLLPNLLWLCLMMPLLARRLKAAVYYSPLPCLPYLLPRSMKTIIVVHDVVNLEFQHTMQWTNKLSNALFFNRSVRQADILWTNSQYTKRKVEQYFPQRRCSDIFTGCSVNRSIYRPLCLSDEEKDNVRNRYGISSRFMLFVGSLEPRKNLSFLLSLMPTLYYKHHLQLVVVGGRGWKNSPLSQVVNAHDFPRESTIFCGFVSNDELARLYNSADCFVSASLNEGFGMPQLEALLCGCPIVTAHNSAMIEVAQDKDGATTVEGYDPQQWTATIVDTAIHRPQVNTTQLKVYDWKVIIKNLLQAKAPFAEG